VAFDRDSTLKKGEKFLRQGRLDAAIGEYLCVVEAQPRDWNTANLLGDLHFRAGQPELALGQYHRIADQLTREGFHPKAAALYRKVLKLIPDDEDTQLLLADVSVHQGLLADAKRCLQAVACRRRARGDTAGVADLAIRIGSLDPADFEARLEAARTLEELGRAADAAERFRAAHDDLTAAGRLPEALDALRQAVRLNPGDRDGRTILARTAIASGDVLAARGYLDRDTAGDDPALLVALVEIELRSGETASARALMSTLLAADARNAEPLLATAWALSETEAAAAYACVDVVTDARIGANDFTAAAAHLEAFAARCPGHVQALLKLVEVCVDGSLEEALLAAQGQLADAYLENGHAAEARFIAEDLLARNPSADAHIARYRRALVLLEVEDPDTHIAERLTGQVPFLASEPFLDLSIDDEPVETTPAVPAFGVQDTSAGAIASSSPPPPGVDVEIDLAGALADFDAPADMDDVFAGMRAGAATEAEFADQYVKLARKYVEMGMIDQAVESLQTASRSPAHHFEAAAALGRLYMRQGNAVLAIQWLEHAAEALAPTTHDGRALLYDLGMLLDATGDSARALAIFDDLQADAGEFRDVRSRIARLARPAGGG
jgi:tetratricopeptide (TPR) repeat protein